MTESWLPVEKNSNFPLENLPFGIFKTATLTPRAGVALGNYVIDLSALYSSGLMNELGIRENVFNKMYLNDFIGLGKPVWQSVRTFLQTIFHKNNPSLQDNPNLVKHIVIPAEEVQMLMPVYVRDYTDFYSSEEHATNVGIMFRGKENALMPNWKHLPVGYHGRASSIVVSGEPLHRPKGQTRPDDAQPPVFGPSKQMDFELEMAFIIGKGTQLGDSVSTEAAEDHIFGMVVFNDWSARDLQKWEYVPLGPFLGKNFGSSVSPWVVTMDALAPFKTEGPVQNPEVLPYLQYTGKKNYDIHLEVQIQPAGSDAVTVSRSNHKYLYWNMAQQLAHHTINGCNLNIGDMMASGTISGPTEDSFGSMLEIAWKGTKPVDMADGSKRTFIQDYDTVIMKAWCEKEGIRIGFGEVKTQILPVKA
ncbi:MAG: fumarylacetoacetase [Bacteroidia bacterium]|nr:fumarylacetoacetase [Bacteroidia bacterium]